MNMRGLLGVLALGLLIGGCASGDPPQRTESQPRTQCLNDRNESGNSRPLFFLFCVQSP